MPEDSAQIIRISAQIAHEAYKVSVTARQLSFIAKSTTAVVLRTGHAESGLKVLSEFFSELATHAIENAAKVDDLIVGITGNVVAQWRIESFIAAAARAHSIRPDLDLKGSDAQVKAHEKLMALKHEFYQRWHELVSCLDEIEQEIKAGAVIAVNFRLEAMSVGMSLNQLDHLSNEIDTLSDTIKTHVQQSLKLLREFRLS